MKHYLRFLITLLIATVWCAGGYAQIWEKVDLTNLTTNDVFVIVDVESNGSYALTSKNGSSSAPSATKITLSSDGNSISSEISDDLKWNITSDNDSYTFYPNGSKTKWLYCTASNNGVRVGTNQNKEFTFSKSGKYSGLKNTSTNRYIGVYNKQDWRCYTSSSTNIGSTNICYFKLVSTSQKTPINLSFNSDFDANKIYTFTDGVATNGYVQPTTTLDQSVAVGDGAIKYTSDNTDVVDVDETTGKLSFAGKTVYDTEATITAQFVASESSSFASSNKLTYKVKNVEAQVAKPKMSFSESVVTVMQGKESEFTVPTLTLTDADGNNVTLGDEDIYYESTNGDVAKVNDPAKQEVEFVNPGTTEIKATYIGGNKDYENLTASYTLVYKEKEKVATTVEFTSTDNSVNINESIFVKAVVKSNGEEVKDATVTYSASNDNVKVDENTGEVVGNKEGTSTITATFAGNADYATSTSTFDVTVTDPNKKTVTFDFSKPEDYGYTAPANKGDKTELKDGDEISRDNIILTNVKGGSTSTRFTNDKTSGNITFRIYSGAKLTLVAPEGYAINKVVFDDVKKCADLTCTPGALDSQTWSGLTNIIILTVPKNQVFLNSMTVTCIKNQELALGEGNNDKVIGDAAEVTDNLYDVTLNRSMIADGGWYTFCVPFDVADVSTTPLKDAEIRQYKSMTGPVMNFESTTSLKAAHAYLVKPTKNIENPVFNNVVVSLGDSQKDGADGYEFVGIYSEKTLATDGTNLFLGEGNKFYQPTEDDKTLKALRGYFVAPSAESGAKMGISIDGGTTYINGLTNGKVMTGKVYNLNGQYVGNDMNALQKGVYVVNGRKYIVK